MKLDPDVGKRYYFKGKRYLVIKTDMRRCANCDANEDAELCKAVRCMRNYRRDGNDVILKLQPLYKKQKR